MRFLRLVFLHTLRIAAREGFAQIGDRYGAFRHDS